MTSGAEGNDPLVQMITGQLRVKHLLDHLEFLDHLDHLGHLDRLGRHTQYPRPPLVSKFLGKA